MRRLAALVLLTACEAAPPALAVTEPALIRDGRGSEVFGQRDFATGALPSSVQASTTSHPSAVTTDATFRQPYVMVTDREAHRVLFLTTSGSPLSFYSVYGQLSTDASLPNFGNPTPSRNSLHTPSATAFVGPLSELGDSSQWVAVADTVNHRVLVANDLFSWFPSRVLGQSGDFATGTPSKGGVHAGSLEGPSGVAFDPTVRPPRLYVADTGHHRVLRFEDTSTTAALCWGQPSCFDAKENAGAGPSATSFSSPAGMFGWFLTTNVGDPMRGLWVADTGNHRVVHLSIGGVADFVLGQPDLTTAKPNAFGASARSLRSPSGVALDPVGNVWVADTGNHRVLRFKKGSQIADAVIGQPSFDAVSPPTVVDATTLYLPGGVAVGSNGDLFVADTGHSRVLRYFLDCATDSCDDGDPCTDDYCDPFERCYHALTPVSKECSPYTCAVAQRRCAGSCDASHPCAPGFSCVVGHCVQRCTSDATCPSGHCADGICCATACPGDCESCSQLGREGTCAVLPSGATPTYPKACPGGASGCSRTCDGVSRTRCADEPAGTTCGERICEDGVATLLGKCDGGGFCHTEAKTCAPYACDRAACRGQCEFDHDCVGGARCREGVCAVEHTGGGGCALSSPGSAAPATLALLAVLGARRRRRP